MTEGKKCKVTSDKSLRFHLVSVYTIFKKRRSLPSRFVLFLLLQCEKKCKVNAKNNVRPTVKMIGVFMRAVASPIRAINLIVSLVEDT